MVRTLISIHSLRVEEDFAIVPTAFVLSDFNPLPPCGGRLLGDDNTVALDLFQSTPSVWRETIIDGYKNVDRLISIHSLRVEGDA